MEPVCLSDSVIVRSLLNGDERTLADDVLDGLTRPFKELPPKYFYDERGSELFDLITALPEYYPTRCERQILNRHSPEIVEESDAEELVELGERRHASRAQRKPAKICRRRGKSQLRMVLRITRKRVAQEPPRSTL